MTGLPVHERPSPNHDARPAGQTVDILLLHYTGMESGEAALERMCDPTAKVSAHYCVEEDGRVFQLVGEDRRAWHAGHARWQGADDINARSIGIEIVNPGHEFGYRPFPAAQMASVTALAQDILERHPIPAERVLGHADVAPLRKEDPGELFDWPGLAAAGVGLWPAYDVSGDSVTGDGVTAALTTLGYGFVDEDPAAVIRAFQRRYRPAAVTGEADAETRKRLAAVLRITAAAG
ncbi:N-acetylmuramoyl-L-alanine amidase [Pelagibius litoralis]|uniref:N-acetylmuramoyl-L-alanine amidase n=1 Tax=Pelagibius litoralis TaxID=374515 RepID=A0A967EWV8_9PROT|nr:N-acetylmuramoyl-L-alanine amidase [Pelagibius litoralis]NIA68613.1 N-acetylmuramoyl-L-alanine amidase [Pelagibius litoralis]